MLWGNSAHCGKPCVDKYFRCVHFAAVQELSILRLRSIEANIVMFSKPFGLYLTNQGIFSLQTRYTRSVNFY